MFVCLFNFLSIVSSWENFSPGVPAREASLLFPEKGLSIRPTHRFCPASHHYCVADRVFFLDHCLSSFQAPADRIYWLSCSGDTVVEGPKKLGTANLAPWYYNQQTPKRTLLPQLLVSGLTCSARSSQMYCRTSLQLRNLCRLMDESQKCSLKKILQMFKWLRNSQLTPFAWPSP